MKITGVRPWLVKSGGSYWGEFLFVEVTTDEDVSGWGEITTTTKLANRALCAMVRQIGAALVGENPADIERLWHKTFRSFTYMGSRGAAVECVSAIDIALWDIRGKVLGLPIYELLGGPVRDEIALYTHPDQRKFTSKEAVVSEIRDIVKSGHTAFKFDPFPQQGRGKKGEMAREQRDGYLDGSMTRKDQREAAELTALIRETTGPDIELLIDAHGRFDVPTAIRLCRSLEEAGDIDWFEEPVPPGEPQCSEAGAREDKRSDLLGRARPHKVGLRSGAREQARRLHHARRHLDRRHHRTQEDFGALRGLLHTGLTA